MNAVQTIFPMISSSLQWLPICFCIEYKLLLFVFTSLNGSPPTYLDSLVDWRTPDRSLRISHFWIQDQS